MGSGDMGNVKGGFGLGGSDGLFSEAFVGATLLLIYTRDMD